MIKDTQDSTEFLVFVIPIKIIYFQGFLMELVTTFVLVLVILVVSDENRAPVSPSRGESWNVPLAAGLTVGVCHLVAIPFTGCGLNPARTLGMVD